MMNRFDPTSADVRNALSDNGSQRHQLSRRYFLQAAAAAGGVAMLPIGLADMAAAAAPIGATDGVLVVLNMEGGNDGLNTVVPHTNGTYYDLRQGVAIQPSAMLPITGNRGLHPELGYIQGLYYGGQVAVIDGVGDPESDLSHFTSAARWMTGRAGHAPQTSGWLGRYMDGLGGGADPFHAVAIGRTVPLSMQGNKRRATALPTNPNGIFDPANATDVDRRQMAALDSMGSGSTGLGALGDNLAQAGRMSLAIAGQLAPAYGSPFPEDRLAADMILAARLINANLGVRVIEVSYGDFDGHAGHAGMHRDRMQELNAALFAFHQALSSQFADRTMILTVSEFGRRAKSNNSGGTDHGSASTLMAIGPGVAGGFYGSFPSLSELDRRGNQIPTVDFRSVYATVLDRWLASDSSQVLGANFEDLAFVGTPGQGSGGQGSTPPAVVNLRSQLMRLYLAYFMRLPDAAGLEFWHDSMRQGVTLSEVSQIFAESPEFVDRYGQLNNTEFIDRVYLNVLDRPADGDGGTYWAGLLDAGATRGAVMVGFSESGENIRDTANQLYEYDSDGPVARLYSAYFLRTPDPEGLAYWTDAAVPLEAVSESFAQSTEFKTRYGTLSNQAFVELVYLNVMEREPDNSGQAFWVDQLYRGTTRGQMMVGFSESPEFKARFATGTI